MLEAGGTANHDPAESEGSDAQGWVSQAPGAKQGATNRWLRGPPARLREHRGSSDGGELHARSPVAESHSSSEVNAGLLRLVLAGLGG